MSHLSALTSPILPTSHGFFTRKGGVSTSPYDTLNASYFVGDRPSHVRHNLHSIITHFTPHPPHQNDTHQDKSVLRLFFPRQVHGKRVCIVSHPHIWQDNPHAHVRADALVTQHPQIALGITTADCLPILLFEPKSQTIGAIHAGWRGLTAGIIAETVQTMKKIGATPANIRAAIGPAIGMASYQVGENLLQHLSDDEHHFVHKFAKNDNRLDLISLTRYRLCKEHIPKHLICTKAHQDTYTNPELFFSCRRALHLRHTKARNTLETARLFGCQASVISLLEPKPYPCSLSPTRL